VRKNVKLHSPVFEKELRSCVKREVKASPQLKKEARRLRARIPLEQFPFWQRRLIFLPLLPSLVWVVFDATHRLDFALAAINSWTSLAVFFFAVDLGKAYSQWWNLAAFEHLPFADSTPFRWELWKRFPVTLLTLADVVLGLGALAYLANLPWGSWLAIIFAAPLIWALIVALALLGAPVFARIPQVLVPFLIAILVIPWAIGISSYSQSGPATKLFFDKAAPAFNLLCPTGWPLVFFHFRPENSGWTTAFLLLPIGLIIWSLVPSLKELRSRLQYKEAAFRDAPEQVPGQKWTWTIATSGGSPSIGVTAIEEGIRSGQFLKQPDWNHGWMESLLWQWFTPEEKALAEWAFPYDFNLTKAWKKVGRDFLLVALLTWGIHYLDPALSYGVYTIGVAILLARSGGWYFSYGVASRALGLGVRIPIYAGFPITYYGLSRMLLKYSLTQLPLIITLLGAAGTVFSVLTGYPLESCVLLGVNAGFFLFGARYFSLVFLFLQFTQASSKSRLWTLFVTLVLVVFTVFFVILFILPVAATVPCLFDGDSMGVSIEKEPLTLFLPVISLLVGYTVFRAYGWLIYRGRFDLTVSTTQ
jgi:hypothetical protein